MTPQEGNEPNGEGAQRRTVRRRRRRGRRGSGSTADGAEPEAAKAEGAIVSETAETITRIESDTATSRDETRTSPSTRLIDELGEIGTLILGEHKPSPCSRFILKEYFD